MKQVILVRKDLRLKPGKLSAQVAHGAVGAAISTYIHYKSLYNEWETSGMKKVVLKVKDEKELVNLYNQAKDKNIPCFLVQDAGLTTFHGKPTLTVAALGPADNWQLDPIVGHLKLL
jgi:PTH2 family peptidyl-tRNA hydrolase